MRNVNVPEPRVVNFLFHKSGMGDYVNYLAAIKYIAEEMPHVCGVVHVPLYFASVTKNVIGKYEGWTTMIRESPKSKELLEKYPTYESYNARINPCGTHQLDLGFQYFANITAPKRARVLPYLVFPDLDPLEEFPIKKGAQFIVINPYASAENRQMPAELFNYLTQEAAKRGYEVVLLGVDQMGKRKMLWDPGYNIDVCTNLTNKTDLYESAHIMSRAQAVIGFDNGLLHLAGMTATKHIVFVHTITDPEHRKVLRNYGKDDIDVYLSKKELACSGCQSTMRFINQDFGKCYYGDNICTKMIGHDKAFWDQVLNDVL